MKDDQIANRDTRVFLPGKPDYNEMISSREHSVTKNDPQHLKRKTQISDILLKLSAVNVVDSGLKQHQHSQEENISPYISLAVNTSGSLTQLSAMQTMRTMLKALLDVKDESLWKKYNILHKINQEDQIMTVYIKGSLCRMIIVKRITLSHLMNIKHLREHRHKNLIALLKIYKFENMLFAVMKYTVVILAQIIVISLKLLENHVFCVCSQISVSHIFINLHSLTSTGASENEISIEI